MRPARFLEVRFTGGMSTSSGAGPRESVTAALARVNSSAWVVTWGTIILRGWQAYRFAMTGRRNGYFMCVSQAPRNLEIDETKDPAVDPALQHLAGIQMTREQALAMRGAHAIGEVPADAGPRC